MDATHPHVVLGGEDVQTIHPDVTPQELREQFAQSASTTKNIIRALVQIQESESGLESV